MSAGAATTCRASVVLPVRDGGERLGRLLEALDGQELAGGLEVVAVDSGSTDGSAERLARHGARVLRIAPSAFDHGASRNLGVRAAGAEIVVFMSQDAVPADAHCVRRLVEALEGDARLAGAFARQVPREDADPLTRRDLGAWVASGTAGRVSFRGTPEDWAGRTPLERVHLAAFDNVASAARRRLLLDRPFAPTRFGEDIEWGLAMLERGHGLAYVPEAVVVHSHRRSARELFRRSYLCHRALHRLFGLERLPDRRRLVSAAARAVAADLWTLAREGAGLASVLAAPAQAVAALYGEYRGAGDERAVRPYPDWA